MRHSSRSRQNEPPIEERQVNTREKANNPDCRICRMNHPLRKCKKFLKMTVADRLTAVKRHNYCRNCLAHSHCIKKCRSQQRCSHCNIAHHSLLHHHSIIKVNAPISQAEMMTVVPTVIIKIRLNNEWHQVRGLLNPCAAMSAIANFLVDRYRIPFERLDEIKWCQLTCKNRFDEGGSFTVRARVTSTLPERLSKKRLDRSVTDAYRNLRLADPDFFENNSINFILGADIYPKIVRSGLQYTSIGSPLAQDTVLGWVIIGRFAD